MLSKKNLPSHCACSSFDNDPKGRCTHKRRFSPLYPQSVVCSPNFVAFIVPDPSSFFPHQTLSFFSSRGLPRITETSGRFIGQRWYTSNREAYRYSINITDESLDSHERASIDNHGRLDFHSVVKLIKRAVGKIIAPGLLATRFYDCRLLFVTRNATIYFSQMLDKMTWREKNLCVRIGG